MSTNSLSDSEIVKRLDAHERNIEFLDDYELMEFRQLREVAIERGLILNDSYVNELRELREKWK